MLAYFGTNPESPLRSLSSGESSTYQLYTYCIDCLCFSRIVYFRLARFSFQSIASLAILYSHRLLFSLSIIRFILKLVLVERCVDASYFSFPQRSLPFVYVLLLPI